MQFLRSVRIDLKHKYYILMIVKNNIDVHIFAYLFFRVSVKKIVEGV